MDIRKSDIRMLEEKVRRSNYKKYLRSLTLSNVRSFEHQEITFDFPVTAIIGTNGGGKSTILGAAALAYMAVKPGDFFPKSNIGDTSMANWRIDYKVIDRDVKANVEFPTNARFTSAKWRRSRALIRDVVVVPIQRTVPASEQTKYKKFIGLGQKNENEIRSEKIPDAIASYIGRVLGKDSSGYQRIWLSNDSGKSILSGIRRDKDYSQFHFGAGEASVIEMIVKLEGASENSLILIEEIENGLHPLATRKIVEYLFDVAKRKKSQVIFTTHSEYALEVLPPNAIWGCIDGIAYQGKLTIESLRALTGTISKDRVIFVEDDFAKDLCNEIVRQYIPELLNRVEIHKAGGFPYVVDVLEHHNKNPTINSKAIAIIDGDNPPLREENNFVFKLPGDAPETLVFGYIVKNAESIANLIQQRCQCPTVRQDNIVEIIRKVERDTTDHHLYFSKMGNELGFVSEIITRRGLCSIYVEESKEELMPLVEALKAKLVP